MKTVESVTATFARNSIGTVWEMARKGPIAVTSAGKTIAYVLAPEDFERTQRKPRTLGFARDLIGEFDLHEFNSVTAEEMGFGQYMP
ncbi:MAG: hypothetical protein ACLQVD_09480 [Capsulimonadaceae bacterium]